MSLIDWRAELSRGALSYGTLLALAGRPRHGYELRTLLRETVFPHLQGGTLYPLLRRLELDGLIAHTWDTSQAGPARKVHELTALGREELRNAQAAWEQISALLDFLDRTKEGL